MCEKGVFFQRVDRIGALHPVRCIKEGPVGGVKCITQCRGRVERIMPTRMRLVTPKAARPILVNLEMVVFTNTHDQMLSTSHHFNKFDLVYTRDHHLTTLAVHVRTVRANSASLTAFTNVVHS